MKPGVTVEQAQADLSSVAAILEAEYPERHANVGLAIFGLRDDLTRDAKRPLC